MSCDESVMKHMDTDIRKKYSASLLSFAAGRKIMAGMPLAFGESDTKSRIKNVLDYKKPGFWMIIAALIIVLAVCAGLASNPLNSNKPQDSIASLLKHRIEVTEPEPWNPQPEYENEDGSISDDYWEALAAANASDKTEEIAVEDMGDNEKTALAWMEAWFDMYKALPEDSMAYISAGTVDDLDIIKVSKEGQPKAFVFSVTLSVRPTYPIGRNVFWMAGNTGNSPGRDETWGQMYREVELRIETDGRYHFVEMGTGGVGHSKDYEDIPRLEP